MDIYTQVSFKNARTLIMAYSSSFGLSSRLFGARLRPHIYNIYSLARVADEIVDTYRGKDAEQMLADLEQEVYQSLPRVYSVNPIVHAFVTTAHSFGITKQLLQPFFLSMRTDLLPPSTLTQSSYQKYIYGSAEVIGLMCLRVFCEGNTALYERLAPGAARLGAAYQKVNFLRDFERDYKDLDRIYFPGVTYQAFDESAKRAIIKDIEQDFSVAYPAIMQLPTSSRVAVLTSYVYYKRLLRTLDTSSIQEVKTKRVRVSGFVKVWLLVSVLVWRAWRTKK